MPQVVVAAAAAIGSAITVALGSGATAAAVGAAAANTIAALGFAQGIGAAVSAWATVASVATVARGRPKIGGAFGSQVDFKADPNAGIPYVMGQTGVGGNIVFATTAETKNAHLLYLTVLSGAGPIDGVVSFTANEEAITFSSGNAVNARYHNKMVESRQIGAQTPATFFPPATTLGSFADWTSAHKLTGYAAQWWVLEYDQKAYPNGTPKPLTVIKGVKVYDPRLDSSYPGGSGTQDAADESTWTWSENPFLHALTWCIGRFQNGARILGVGAALALIDVAAFVEGANVADANGWTIGGSVYSTDDKWQALAAMLQAGGGWPTALGAKISCGFNAPKVSLATLTAADQAGGEVSITAVRSRRDKFNGVIPRYRSADHRYEVVAAAKISVPAYLSADAGDDHTAELEFPLCPAVDQAAQLGLYAVANSREFGPIVIPAKPRWWGLQPNDCITLDEDAWALSGQKAVILARDRDPATGVVTFTLQSETDGKHPFCLGETGTPPADPTLAFDPTDVPLPEAVSWTATGTVLSSTSGALPVISITGAVDTALVQSIIVEYRERLTVGPPATYGPWVTLEFPVSTTEVRITDVKPGVAYQVRIRYRNAQGVEDPTTGTNLGTITPGAVVSGTEADTTAPSAPSALATTAAFESVFLSWTNPSDSDLDKVEIWENTVNTQPNPTTQPTLRIGISAARPGTKGAFGRLGLSPGVTRYYWLRAVDRAGNISAFNASGGTSASTLAIELSDFGTGVRPMGRGTSLPTASTYDSDTFYLTTDQQVYRKNAAGTGWTVATPAANVTGTLTNSQIADLAAAKITGTLTNSQIADLAAAKITGTITTTQIANNAITTPLLNAGAVTTAKIAALNVTATEIAATSITTAKIAANAVTATEILAGSITTAKIAAGAVTATELAANSVIAAKIAAGVITASHIASATITGTQIAATTITAANIVAGTLTADRLVVGTLTATQITGGGLSSLSTATNSPALTLTATPQTIVSRTLATGDDDVVLIDAALFMSNFDGAERFVVIDFYRDATLIGVRGKRLLASGGDYAAGTAYDEPPANTTVTYYVKASCAASVALEGTSGDMHILRYRR